MVQAPVLKPAKNVECLFSISISLAELVTILSCAKTNISQMSISNNNEPTVET